MSNINDNNIEIYPKNVLSYLSKVGINDLFPVCFLSSPSGNLLEYFGDTKKYKYQDVSIGDNLFELISFTQGLIPFDDEFPLFLDCVEIENGIFSDIHVLPKDKNGNNWIIFFFIIPCYFI